MKTTMAKKLIAVISIMAVCLTTLVCPIAVNAETPENTVTPRYIAMASTGVDLQLGLFGKLTCIGKTGVQYGYTAEVIVELQQSGNWHTIQTWTDRGSTAALVEQTYYVESGYTYRLKVTHTSYDSNGRVVETWYEFSDSVDY